MLPVISLGGLQLSSYWMMFAAGVCSMGVLMLRGRGGYGLTARRALILTLLLTVCGLAGTKLLYILENWQETLENGVTLGGQSFFGAVFLIPLLMPLGGRLLGLSPGRTLDLCAPSVASIVGFMRVGCFLNGCCGGWEAVVGEFHLRWPTQAMESIGDFLILGILLRMEEQDAHPGRRYAVFLVCYGILRFFVEFLRDTLKDWAGMGHGQWFALLSILIGGIVLFREKRQAGRAARK